MSRRRQAEKREILPDARFGSPTIARFINAIMGAGKKSVAENIVYGAIEIIGKRHKTDKPVEAFLEAIDSVKPNLEVKSRRIGGATYQVPVEVREPRATTVAIRWMIKSARGRNEKTMIERLSNEILDILNGRGSTLKKKEETHKMAEANRAFAHFRVNF